MAVPSFTHDFNSEQITILVVFAVAQCFNAICFSLLAPFYPGEAASKGATATECGLVIGVYELIVFLFSPLLGKQIVRLGGKNVFCAGMSIVSFCGMGFGLLDSINSRVAFIGASLAVRMMQAFGCACFKTSCLALIGQVFPGGVATVFAIQETFFGVGIITGPMVGSVLYQASGNSFMAPFLITSFCLAVVAMFSFCLLSRNLNMVGLPSDAGSGPSKKAGLGLLISVPWVFVGVCSVVSVSTGIGFLTVGLEMHLRKFDFSPVEIGLMFSTVAVSYAASSPLFGYFCDKTLSPLPVNCFGLVLCLISFLIMGPVWDKDASDPSLLVQVLSLVFNGLSHGAVFVSTYALFHRQAIQHGFEDDLVTSGTISGMWTSAFALGAFLGPLAGGALLDKLEFALAALVLPGAMTMAVLLMAVTYGVVLAVRRAGYKELSLQDSGIGSTAH